MNIRRSSLEQLDELTMLFDQYMGFYKQPSSPQKYRKYLSERLQNNEATAYIAYSLDNEPVGFVLNYHSFSSVSLGKIIVLNDLFVVASHRKKGVANKLIDCSINLAKSTGSIRVDLATAKDNLFAQRLYEKIGFVKDAEYFSYNLSL